jgi:putative flippase GtrA
MKEFFSLLSHGRMRALLLEPTQNNVIQFVRYMLVGGLATVADWVLLFGFEYLIVTLSDSTWVQTAAKYIAAVIGFTAGLVINFLLTRAFVFNGQEARAGNTAGEFAGHLVVGVIGLLLTEMFLWFGDLLSIHFMLAKVVATVIVFFWNYLARKFIVYKKK